VPHPSPPSTQPPPPTSPRPPPSKPPITQVYTRRRSAPTELSLSPSSVSPDAPVFDDSNASDGSHAASGEPPVGQQYNLRDRAAIRLPDKLGFPRVSVVTDEPSTYHEASSIPEWQDAMSEELAALECTGTWDLVPLPSHAVPITCKWVFKIKTKSDGSIERYKARLVARVFSRQRGMIMMRHLLLLHT